MAGAGVEMRRAWIAALALVAWAAQAQGLAPLVDARGQISPGWRVAGLPQQAMPLTRYSADKLDERSALRIDARASYGNLVHDITIPSAARTLQWSWRVERANPAADLRIKAGDDAAAKVCLSFDMALEQVPFFERQLLRLARSRSAEALPAATLCYVWAAREPVGTLLDNAYTRRVRMIVLRSGDSASGSWADERRDIGADFRRAFGDESAALPPLSAVIVSGDADNTGASSLAFVSDLRLLP